jgi:hypothetical protein
LTRASIFLEEMDGRVKHGNDAVRAQRLGSTVAMRCKSSNAERTSRSCRFLRSARFFPIVMAGLDPAIHVLLLRD